MSAVTLQEIADLVAAELKTPIADMRSVKSNDRSEKAERIRTARNVVIVLAWRHAKTPLGAVVRFFGLTPSGALREQFNTTIETSSAWIGRDAQLFGKVEAVEQKIDALHERRMAMRDRKVTA